MLQSGVPCCCCCHAQVRSAWFGCPGIYCLHRNKLCPACKGFGSSRVVPRYAGLSVFLMWEVGERGVAGDSMAPKWPPPCLAASPLYSRWSRNSNMVSWSVRSRGQTCLQRQLKSPGLWLGKQLDEHQCRLLLLVASCCCTVVLISLSLYMLLTCAEYCITEDYALSMELKAAGFKGAYLVRLICSAWQLDVLHPMSHPALGTQ